MITDVRRMWEYNRSRSFQCGNKIVERDSQGTTDKKSAGRERKIEGKRDSRGELGKCEKKGKKRKKKEE